ncbi:FUSC family protein [Paramicrobacterium agarici]|nr:FUSC family protein [Microbacterium agarici]
MNVKVVKVLRASAAELFTGYRFLVAAKAAVAVVAAWLLGQLLPGELDEYAYYAPLGALLGVTPTVVDSIRTSIEMVAGIALGVLIGWLLIATGMPWFLRAPIGAGLGVWIAGVRVLGSGRVYVAIAAVFVVILGVDDPESYALGYIAQFGLGLVIGTLANVVLIPPLRFSSARARIASLQTDFANHIEEIANVLDERWPPKGRNWLHYARDLRSTVDSAEQLVNEARRSRRANPRALWTHDDTTTEYEVLDTVRRIAVQMSQIAQVLNGAIWNEPIPAPIPHDIIEPLRDALGDLSDFVRDLQDDDAVPETRERCLRSCDRVIAYSIDGPDAGSGIGTIIFAVRAIRATVADGE